MSIPTREEMIKALTESMFDAMECDADYRWNICKFGHVGFENMTNDELVAEYKNYIDDDEEVDHD